MTSETGDRQGRIPSRIAELEETYREANRLHTYLKTVLAKHGEVHEVDTPDEFSMLGNATAFPGWNIALADIDPMLHGSKSFDYPDLRPSVMFHERPGIRYLITDPISLMFEPTEDHSLFSKFADGSSLETWAIGEECVVIDGHAIAADEIRQLHEEIAALFPLED